jgi:hypothetical protein
MPHFWCQKIEKTKPWFKHEITLSHIGKIFIMLFHTHKCTICVKKCGKYEKWVIIYVSIKWLGIMLKINLNLFFFS